MKQVSFICVIFLLFFNYSYADVFIGPKKLSNNIVSFINFPDSIL